MRRTALITCAAVLLVLALLMQWDGFGPWLAQFRVER